MDAAALAWIGAVAAALGVVLLRFAWGRPTRSTALNSAGWGLLLLGVVLGGFAFGAWGVAMASLAAMLVAFMLLVGAGLRTRGNGARASGRRANILPERAPLMLGRRLVTFLFNVPLALAVALAVALGARVVAALGGWQDANSNVLALLLFPLVWAVLVTAMLMTGRRRVQALMLALPGLLGGLLVYFGVPA